MDNHAKYTFRVRLRNGLTIGAGLISEAFQPIGTPGTPARRRSPTRRAAGSIGAVSLTWPEVDPNGPGPVRYTVLKDGSPMPNCTNIPTRRLRQHQPDYDGTIYQYTVVATNAGGKGVSSAPGRPTQWQATGRPASWGAWSVRAHGQQQPGRASFTVPPSRGADSVVRVYVDGTKVAAGRRDRQDRPAVRRAEQPGAAHA